MKMVITVEVKDPEEGRLIAKSLQDDNVRALAVILGKLRELDIDPGDYGRVIEMAYGVRFGKGRH